MPPGRLDLAEACRGQTGTWTTSSGCTRQPTPTADGVFVDGPIESSQLVLRDTNFTLASKRAMLAGVAGMLRDATTLLSSHNKVLTASLGAHYSRLEASAWTKSPDSEGGGICPPGMA